MIKLIQFTIVTIRVLVRLQCRSSHFKIAVIRLNEGMLGDSLIRFRHIEIDMMLFVPITTTIN